MTPRLRFINHGKDALSLESSLRTHPEFQNALLDHLIGRRREIAKLHHGVRVLRGEKASVAHPAARAAACAGLK